MKKYIGTSNNGKNIFVDLSAQHMLAHAQITEELLHEAVVKAEYQPPFQMMTINMDRIIGGCHCVSTSPEDTIVWENRPGRTIPSRMVLNRTPEPTNFLTMGICRDRIDGLDTIFTAWIGTLSPKEIYDPRLEDNEREAAVAFWATHALIAEA